VPNLPHNRRETDGEKNVPRRFLAGLLALGWACACAWCEAAAEDWPQRTVTVYVPFIAGSTPDAIARTVADRLQARLGQPFVVENRAGASGNTGTAAVARLRPTGIRSG
jgi:tripartite-type tricarboxylate transporter receptor subunit TctC